MIALILARGGSKGVPKKNIKLLNGKPLIFYVIEAGQKSKLIDKIYISTDDKEIANICQSLGVEIIIRPNEISQDNSTDLEAFRHFCEIKNHTEPIVHLRATTPILNPDVIDSAIITFTRKSDSITSLRSVHEMSESALKSYLIEDELCEPISRNLDYLETPRQLCVPTYHPNGYVDIINPETFKKCHSFYGNKIYGFITEFTPEIDTQEDFEYIEFLMNKRNV